MISCCSFFSCWKHTFASSSTSDPLPTGTVGLQQTTVAAAAGAERGSGESPPHRALPEQPDCSHVGSGFKPDLVAVIEACKKSSQIREQRGDLQMDLKHRSQVTGQRSESDSGVSPLQVFPPSVWTPVVSGDTMFWLFRAREKNCSVRAGSCGFQGLVVQRWEVERVKVQLEVLQVQWRTGTRFINMCEFCWINC